jgi:hypothetical protein
VVHWLTRLHRPCSLSGDEHGWRRYFGKLSGCFRNPSQGTFALAAQRRCRLASADRCGDEKSRRGPCG